MKKCYFKYISGDITDQQVITDNEGKFKQALALSLQFFKENLQLLHFSNPAHDRKQT